MNRFYDQNIILQWVVSLVMLLGLGLVAFGWIGLIQGNFLAVFLIFVIVPLAQFLVSPFLKLIGFYKYVSPMLLVYGPNNKRYDLHNGTSFDYLFYYFANRENMRWQSRLLQYYIDGLLEIVAEIEAKKIPETIEVRGSSYFFSARTANKLGFQVEDTALPEKLNILLNYLDLTWMYSLAKGTIVLPKLNDIKTAATSGSTLVAKKDELLRLKTFLQNRSR